MVRGGYVYACRTVYVKKGPGPKKQSKINVLMHRQILSMPIGDQRLADHANRNTLDNRRSNLRVCSKAQNNCNTKSRAGSSVFRGVQRVGRKWRASIGWNGNKIYLGHFDSEKRAAKSYNEAAKRLHGEFAHLNELPESA